MKSKEPVKVKTTVDWKIPKSACPVCEEVLDAAMGLGHGEPPNVGAVTLCCGCASALVLGENLELQVCPPELWEEVLWTYPFMQKVREGLLEFNRNRGA
jgi:hypothetical protein